MEMTVGWGRVEDVRTEVFIELCLCDNWIHHKPGRTNLGRLLGGEGLRMLELRFS